MKKIITILAAAAITALLVLFTYSVEAKPKPLYKGWYSVKWLKKHGYQVPPTSKKRIYIMPTADSAKANIKPL